MALDCPVPTLPRRSLLLAGGWLFLPMAGCGPPLAPAAGASPSDARSRSSPQPVPERDPPRTPMPTYELPPLSYAYDALEPFLSARALELHHTKHHAAYVTGANGALEALDRARVSGDHGLVDHWSRKLAFHVSGHFLHSLFWQSMAPRGKTGAASPRLLAAVKDSFGGLDAMKAHFAAAGRSVEGNGWAVLGLDLQRAALVIVQVENHQKQTTFPLVPLLACDVWEHAYYLDYQNRRGDFVSAFWEVVDWQALGARHARAQKMADLP